ncbi:MAG: hypothetical protein ACETWE_12360 [Candidatus Bathyarchaeia archaeon]
MGIKSIGRLACVVTVFGVLQFFLLTFLAALFYPGGYDYFGYYFSDLGAVAARNGEPNMISRALFSVALTIVALALIPFWLVIRRLFKESTVERVFGAVGSASGLIGSPFIIGVALFPIDTQLDTHILVTLTFFSLFVLASLLYSIAITLSKSYSNYSGLAGLVLFAISLVILMDPLASHAAFMQTIVTYGYFIWVLVQIFIVWPLVRSRNSRL